MNAALSPDRCPVCRTGVLKALNVFERDVEKRERQLWQCQTYGCNYSEWRMSVDQGEGPE